MTRPVAALTGATGFLGGHLVRALDAAGYHVRVLARRLPAPPSWTPLDPEIVAGGMHDEMALERLVDGAAVVVHGAGLIKARSRAEFFEANALGARRVAEAARRGGAPGFVLVSSITARRPEISDYAASKASGEQAVREVLDADRLTIVRPPAVYGPGDRETLQVFKAALALPRLPLLGRSDARFALIHAEDAAAQVAALAKGGHAGATYALADARPEGYGWREVMETAARLLDRPPRFFPVPSGAVAALGGLNAALARIGGTAPMLSPGKARELLHPDWSVAAGELAPAAPAPRFDLETGFAQTLAWYRAERWI